MDAAAELKSIVAFLHAVVAYGDHVVTKHVDDTCPAALDHLHLLGEIERAYRESPDRIREMVKGAEIGAEVWATLVRRLGEDGI